MLCIPADGLPPHCKQVDQGVASELWKAGCRVLWDINTAEATCWWSFDVVKGDPADMGYGDMWRIFFCVEVE